MKLLDKKMAHRYRAVILTIVLLQICTKSYSFKENSVPESVKLSPRLQTLFSKTKLVCFGRYALKVPEEAQLIMGAIGAPNEVDIIKGGISSIKRQVTEDMARVKQENDSAEFVYNEKGPIEASWQIRYYKGKYAKKAGSLLFKTYVNKEDLTFFYAGAIEEKNDNEAKAAARQATLAKNLRLRAPDEVPDEPGFCIAHAFVFDELYAEQEMASAGIYLPSLPDVTFSISSNKDAYGDYPPAEFEKTERAKLSLLARIQEAKTDQGANYPKRTVLREGKRDVHHWHGEESLIKRANGVHDFEWALVGTPRDVANPSEFGAAMFTKVEHNTVGAASAASVSDDEAVALWDKLLSGLKFRVKVPGAPEGSYFFDGTKPSMPTLAPRQ
jgi:hypothetical protein